MHDFPTDIKHFVRSQMPSTHLMWWMRARIQEINPVDLAVQGQFPNRYFRLFVVDVDATKGQRSGYEIDIFIGTIRTDYVADKKQEGLVMDYRPNDMISLFGHEPMSATHSSFPRWFFHHELGRRGPCFETKYVDAKSVPGPRLKIETEAKAAKTAGRLLGAFLGAAPVQVVPEKNLKQTYTDVSDQVHRYVCGAPDTKFFSMNPRTHSNPNMGGELIK